MAQKYIKLKNENEGLGLIAINKSVFYAITELSIDEVTSIINTFSNSDSPSIDVCNIDVFKNDSKYFIDSSVNIGIFPKVITRNI